MSEHQRFPLSWPSGWKRTPSSARQPARFGTKQPNDYRRAISVSAAIARLADELRKLGARQEVLSTNMRPRLDGLPYSDQREPADTGVAVYFDLNKKPIVLACDKWIRTADNIAAIAAHVEAIRAVDRYGVGRIEQAFAGYAQIQASPFDWWIVLEVSPDATTAQVDEAFRRLARQAHPDAGGSHDQMARLNAARDVAKAAGR